MTSRGINSIDDLMGRCRVDDLTGCWLWGQSFCGAGYPAIWFPPLARRVTLGTAIGFLKTGQKAKPGVFWFCTCTTPNCANPDHRKAGTRAQQMKAHKQVRTPLQRARIARGKRAASAIPDSVVREIRASQEPLKAIAKRLGVSMAYCSRVRRGEMRADLVAPGSSIFAMNGASYAEAA
jgi:hypothetical protein